MLLAVLLFHISFHANISLFSFRSTAPLLCAKKSQNAATPLKIGEKSTWTQKKRKKDKEYETLTMGKPDHLQAHSEHAESDGQDIYISIARYVNKPAADESRGGGCGGQEGTGGSATAKGGSDSSSSDGAGVGVGKEDIFWLHVDIWRCKALADTQFVIAQDPYVLIALPDGTSERTKCALRGGTDPEWNASHSKHITLKLDQKQIPCALAIQVCNENGYFESDDIIGHADATLQFEQLYITEEQLQQGARAKTVPLANVCIFLLQARPGKQFHWTRKGFSC
jgi:hypothetical protein